MSYQPRVRLNIAGLVERCGGPSEIARATSLPRTAAYRWSKTGVMSSRTLEKLKEGFPDLDLNEFFQPH